MAKSMRESSGIFASFYERYLRLVLRFRWPLVLGYLAVAFGLLVCAAAAHGDRVVS